MSSEHDRYAAELDRFARERSTLDPRWLEELRQRAAREFSRTPFPTTHDEDWKYTNVAPILRLPFRPGLEKEADGVDRAAIERLGLSASGASRLVLVNGLHSEALSSVEPHAKRPVLESLSSAIRAGRDGLELHLGRYAAIEESAFTALGTSFLRDGAFLRVPPDTALESPLEILFVAHAPGEPIASHARTLIVCGRNSRATLIESYVAPRPGVYFTNAVTEIVLEEGAHLEHVKLLRESERAFHVATTKVVQGRNSAYSSCSISFGAALARSDLDVLLDAEGAECALDGFYLVGTDQHVDNHTSIDHARPHGTSRELYKGILDGNGRAVFSGKIVVRPGADKTDAMQTNKNLILSERAEIDTKPQLEIFADDVKCKHGAAIGQLEPQALFYLQSRGMSPSTARRVLTYGFASEVIERIREPGVRRRVEELVLARVEALGPHSGNGEAR